MIKRKNLFLPTFCIIVLEVMYFLWQPYYKCIFNCDLILNRQNALSDVMTNIFYYIIYFFVYIVIALVYFCSNEIITSDIYTEIKLHKKKYFYLFIKLFFLRIIADVVSSSVIYFVLSPGFSWSIVLFQQIVEVMFTLSMYWILFRSIQHKMSPRKAFRDNKKTIIFILGVWISLVCVLFAVTVFVSLNLAAISDKYIETSQILFTQTNKASLFSQGLNILINIFTSFVALFICVRLNGTEDNTKEKTRRGCLVTSRIAIIIFFAAVLSLVKMLLLPYSFIGEFSDASDNTINYKEYKNFDAKYSVFSFSRLTGYSSKEQVYENINIDIRYSDDNLLSFNSITTQRPSKMSIQNDTMEISTPLQKISINEVEAKRLGTEAIMYLDGDKPVALLTSDISKQKENPILTMIIEQMITEGYWDFYELGSSYLLRYDKNFISPYIERYASGEFNSNEQLLNNDTRTDYIIEFSKQLKKHNNP